MHKRSEFKASQWISRPLLMTPLYYCRRVSCKKSDRSLESSLDENFVAKSCKPGKNEGESTKSGYIEGYKRAEIN